MAGTRLANSLDMDGIEVGEEREEAHFSKGQQVGNVEMTSIRMRMRSRMRVSTIVLVKVSLA